MRGERPFDGNSAPPHRTRLWRRSHRGGALDRLGHQLAHLAALIGGNGARAPARIPDDHLEPRAPGRIPEDHVGARAVGGGRGLPAAAGPGDPGAGDLVVGEPRDRLAGAGAAGDGGESRHAPNVPRGYGSGSMAKVRLDALLAERGLFDSRTRAAASVIAGEVTLGGDRRAEKPGMLVPADAEVIVAEKAAYVSRGGVKLASALDAFGIDPAGRRCLDVGASTGGFTDVLLQGGAAHVVALDVAYGELHWTLRTDPRVTVVERANARYLAPEDLPYAPELVVLDVSFISLTKVLPAVLAACAPAFDVLAMVKPQF